MRPTGTSTKSSGANPISYTLRESWGDAMVQKGQAAADRALVVVEGEGKEEDKESKKFHGAPLKRRVLGRILA